MKILFIKFSVIAITISLAAFARAQNIDKAARFIADTKHLDYLAPKGCGFNAVLGAKKLKGSFELNSKACETSGLDASDPATPIVDAFICTMLIPALNTSGKDLIGRCKEKQVSPELLEFANCGPDGNIVLSLDLAKPSTSISPRGFPAQYLKVEYSKTEGKLMPSAVELKNMNFNQRIQRVEYSGTVPRKLEATYAGGKASLTFSSCRKNHR